MNDFSAIRVCRPSKPFYLVSLLLLLLTSDEGFTDKVSNCFLNVGVRIWNCLQKYKQMESKTIHERALIPHNDAREILYKLLKAGFISLQVSYCFYQAFPMLKYSSEITDVASGQMTRVVQFSRCMNLYQLPTLRLGRLSNLIQGQRNPYDLNEIKEFKSRNPLQKP